MINKLIRQLIEKFHNGSIARLSIDYSQRMGSDGVKTTKIKVGARDILALALALSLLMVVGYCIHKEVDPLILFDKVKGLWTETIPEGRGK